MMIYGRREVYFLPIQNTVKYGKMGGKPGKNTAEGNDAVLL